MVGYLYILKQLSCCMDSGTTCLQSSSYGLCTSETRTTNPVLMVHVLWKNCIYNPEVIVKILYATQNMNHYLLWIRVVNSVDALTFETSSIVHVFWRCISGTQNSWCMYCGKLTLLRQQLWNMYCARFMFISQRSL